MAGQQPKTKGSKQDAPYNFPPQVEKAVVFTACTQPRFMSRAAHELRPELLSSREGQLALEAAQSMFRVRGVGPTSPAATIQWVAMRRDDGKLTTEDVMAVAGLFDAFDGNEKPKVEDIEPLVIDMVKKRMRFNIAQAAVKEHNEAEWDDVQELMRREQALGQGEAGIGLVGTPVAGMAALAELRQMSRCALGIDELDSAIGGGVPHGTLTCLMAAAGGAKSMAMSHFEARMGLRGLFCGYATLELPAPHVLARIFANQTGLTIDEISAGTSDSELQRILTELNPYPAVVQYFEPHVTTPDTIFEWVDTVEKQHSRKLDVLVVDYADKMTASGKPDEKGMYQEMRIVYERLRIFCDRRKLVGITASQSRGRDEKKAKVIDLEHTADSIHKARVVDQFITLNYDDETKEMTFFIAKNRYGEGRKKAGPMPTTFACGQVGPVARARV